MWHANYTGELNKEGLAHGVGSFTNVNEDLLQGTFTASSGNMNPDGYCHKIYSHGEITIGEMKQGHWDGKATDYYNDGLMANILYSNGDV